MREQRIETNERERKREYKLKGTQKFKVWKKNR